MSRNLTADLAADLRMRIVDGVIQPGDKLPSENALIGEFGVSRTVVRSALTRLQAEGLVETERGRGSFALTPPPADAQPAPRKPAGSQPGGPRPAARVPHRRRIRGRRPGGPEPLGTATAGGAEGAGGLHRQRGAPGPRHESRLRVPPGHRGRHRQPVLFRLPGLAGTDHDRHAPDPPDDRRRALRAGAFRTGGARARVHLLPPSRKATDRRRRPPCAPIWQTPDAGSARPPPGAGPTAEDPFRMQSVDTAVTDVATATKKFFKRVLPIMLVMLVCNQLNRSNIGYAQAQLEADVGIGAAAYGLGAGLFFIAYAIFELPSNVMMEKYGAKIWLSRIMISWGIVSFLMALRAERDDVLRPTVPPGRRRGRILPRSHLLLRPLGAGRPARQGHGDLHRRVLRRRRHLWADRRAAAQPAQRPGPARLAVAVRLRGPALRGCRGRRVLPARRQSPGRQVAE